MSHSFVQSTEATHEHATTQTSKQRTGKKSLLFFFFFGLICILCLKQNDPDKAHILPSQRVQTHEANGPEEAGVIIGSTQNVNHSANIYWDVSLTFKRKWEFVQYSAKHFVQMHLSQFCDHSTNS